MSKFHQKATSSSRELRSIGDGQFEILVAGYLRRHRPELAGLIATGINDEGKAIPCPVDGILYVPGSPPRCVAVASTTTSRRELSRKWLGSPNRRGDILKAADEFQAWKRDIPDVECIVYVATNLPLKSNMQLYRQAVRLGHEHGIHIHVIEASQLVDFLDHDQEGQYIREKVLHIEAERLSTNLLREIAQRSLIQHGSRFSVGQNDKASEIVRDAQERVLDSLAGKSLIGIQGTSGTGKSTLLRQIGTTINTSRGIALWVPAEEIVQGSSLAAILLSVLRRFHPSLNVRAGDDAVHFASVLPDGLTLLVDDVNRLPSPHHALAAIQALSEIARTEATATAQRSVSWLRFVVPLWPGQIVTYHSNQQQKQAAWELVLLSTYSARERAAIVKQSSKNTGVQRMIEALNGDPFLCGLAAAIAAPTMGMSPAVLTSRIFSDVIYQATTDAANTGHITATRGEFAAALDTLIEFVLRTEEPEPEWRQIRSVLSGRQADLLHVLSQTNQLSWIEQTDAQETWRWKHDRLRDALVGRWLAQNAVPQLVRGEVSDGIRGWLADPGLAEAWALSLAFLVDKTQQATLLTALGEHHPLALAEILRLNLFPQEKDLRHIIAAGLRHSLKTFDERTREFVGSPHRWTLAKLSQTNDPLVLDITHNLGRAWNIWASRLRNGDISAGLEWVSKEAAHGDFLPSIRFALLEQSIEAFATLYDQRRHIVAQELTQAMGHTDSAEAAMILAGYVAWPELCLPLWDAWSALDNGEQLKTLTACIWALSRGVDQSMQANLEVALLRVRELNDQEQEQGHASERYWRFMEPFHLSQRWPVTSHAAQTWAKTSTVHLDLQHTLCYVLRSIDHPDTIETYVRWSAAEGGTLWDEAFESIDPLSSAEVPKMPVNPSTRARLWAMVEHDRDQTTREVAFRFWKRTATADDLELLRGLPATHPLFEEVLKVRLKLRDTTATNLLIERMNTHPGSWCGYAPHFYEDQGVRDALLSNLEAALDNSQLRADAIAQHLPPDAVRDLLQAKGDLLRNSPRTWPFLWRSEVPEALVFVRDVVSQADPDDLKLFFFRFGFPFPVTQQLLDTLVPGLERFPERERQRIAEAAIIAGFRQWAEEYLPNVVFADEAKNYWLTREKVAEILTAAAAAVPDGVSAVYRGSDFDRLERPFGRRDAVDIDLIEVLRTWLGTSAHPHRLVIAAMLLAKIGTSRDIEWWQSVEPSDNATHTIWSNAKYMLQRRRWQRANTEDG